MTDIKYLIVYLYSNHWEILYGHRAEEKIMSGRMRFNAVSVFKRNVQIMLGKTSQEADEPNVGET